CDGATETVKQLRDANSRIIAERDLLQVKNAHATSVAGLARKAQAEAERFATRTQEMNASLQNELQAAQAALKTERSKTVKVLLHLARLRAERDGLRAALNITDRSASPSTNMAVDSSAAAQPPQSPPPSPSVVSSVGFQSPPVVVSTPPIPPTASPPSLKRKRTPESDPEVQIVSGPDPSPVYRPHVFSSAPRPILPKRATAPALSTSSPNTPLQLNNTGTGSAPQPTRLPALQIPTPPMGSMKRQRTPEPRPNGSGSDPDVEIISPPGPPSHPPTAAVAEKPQPQPPPGSAPQVRVFRVQNQPQTQPQPLPPPQLLPPPQPLPPPPPPPPSRPKQLGLSHLPLLFDTSPMGTMHCRTCKQAFAGNSAWDELVGHAQGKHPESSRDLAALRPAQVIERRQRLQAAKNCAIKRHGFPSHLPPRFTVLRTSQNLGSGFV
ncbi:hypothetical protein FB45DRAFT_1089215, partial [Roridomyces roridus]